VTAATEEEVDAAEPEAGHPLRAEDEASLGTSDCDQTGAVVRPIRTGLPT
jgi:hypothetical protein